MPEKPAPAIDSLIDRIDDALPQTQCRRCGYDDCRAYARALATGEASPNRCAPGGDRGIRVLAALVDRPAAPLDPECGVEGPVKVAWIDEQHAAGSVLSIDAVRDELIGYGDELADWATQRGPDFFLTPDAAVLPFEE